MKIGIITEFTFNKVNFGNHLQTYALNKYLSMKYPDAIVETIVVDTWEKRRYASLFYWLWYAIIRKVLAGIKHTLIPEKRKDRIEQRFQRFDRFAKDNININDTIKSLDQLETSNYDFFIVGSDVVWSQWKGYIRRSKFLDFANKKDIVKISYAASFGGNVIPNENIKLIRRCLARFKMISVREKAAVDLLDSIGVHKAIQVCDPTLLLEREMWETMEQFPLFLKEEISKLLENQGFCFAYLLGNDKKQRKSIERICHQESLLLVTIPYIHGYRKSEGDHFGDIQIELCSPQEWIWLIHHARYVITDSFHGLVFSTIFSTNFISVKRGDNLNLNIRLTDYLSMINENNKYVDICSVDSLSEFHWDFNQIDERLSVFRKNSEEYLRTSINR